MRRTTTWNVLSVEFAPVFEVLGDALSVENMPMF